MWGSRECEEGGAMSTADKRDLKKRISSRKVGSVASRLPPAAERRETNSKDVEDLYLKAKASIGP